MGAISHAFVSSEWKSNHAMHRLLGRVDNNPGKVLAGWPGFRGGNPVHIGSTV